MSLCETKTKLETAFREPASIPTPDETAVANTMSVEKDQCPERVAMSLQHLQPIARTTAETIVSVPVQEVDPTQLTFSVM